MAKWVLLRDNMVDNVIVPPYSENVDRMTSVLQNDGFIINIEDDDVPVSLGWLYDSEGQAYYEPQA